MSESINLLVCSDCAMWAANRDSSGATERWVAWLEGEGAEALAPVVILDSEVHDFVARPCEVGCPNTLAGERFEATAEISGAEVVAEYGDSSGEYRIERDGDMLTTIISEGERLSATLERAPEYDDSDARAEYALTERFSSVPAGDLHPLHDVVWIDSLAYLAIHKGERAYVVSSLIPGGAGRRGYENTAALTMADATELAERLTGLGMAGVTIERTGATDARCSNAPSGEHERAGGVCRFCGK